MWTDTGPRAMRPEGDPPPAFTALLVLGVALVLGLWAYAATVATGEPMPAPDHATACAVYPGALGCPGGLR